MELSIRQEKLVKIVRMFHSGQKRKYTNEPYWLHPFAVAELISKYSVGKTTLAIEIALCHDLFEDTECTYETLNEYLVSAGYNNNHAFIICEGVQELTDKYTPEANPDMNRRARKKMEALRLSKITPLAQNVKYADLIDNTSTIVKYDKEFAKTYLPEKLQILDYMRGGDINLFMDCCVSLKKATEELNETD